MRQKEEKLQRRLEKAFEAQDERREMNDNPFKYAKEFMAMNEQETLSMIYCFEKIDADKTGSITCDELFDYIQEPKNMFSELLFNMLDSLDHDGGLDFGEFLKAVGVFCFFGREELLRYCFSIFDKEGIGTVEHMQVLELLTDLHPEDQGQVNRALKEVDINEKGKMSLEEFFQLDDTFPFLFYPAFKIQDSMRRRIPGYKIIDIIGKKVYIQSESYSLLWWEKKMRKYTEIKKELSTNTDNTDKREAQEAYKQARVENKQKRLVLRKEQALDTSSNFLVRNFRQAQLATDRLGLLDRFYK